MGPTPILKGRTGSFGKKGSNAQFSIQLKDKYISIYSVYIHTQTVDEITKGGSRKMQRGGNFRGKKERAAKSREGGR